MIDVGHQSHVGILLGSLLECFFRSGGSFSRYAVELDSTALQRIEERDEQSKRLDSLQRNGEIGSLSRLDWKCVSDAIRGLEEKG